MGTEAKGIPSPSVIPACINRVQVIISTRNRLADLRYTIDHCLELGLKSEQIMVTDDASTDATPKIIRQYYPDINLYINTTPQGYIRNRNAMMKSSTRDFILSLDDDSNLLSLADLSRAIQLLDSDNDYAVFSFGVIEQKEITSLSMVEEKREFYKNYIGCGHIIKKAVLDKIGYYREELVFYGEEIDFSIRCYQNGYKVVGISGLFVQHRVDRKEREHQLKANVSRGEYSVLWRSSFSVSNTLLKIVMYYPLSLLPFYLIRSLLGQFYFYHIKRNQGRSYWKGLRRWLRMYSYGWQERKPFSVEEFRSWSRLPLYVTHQLTTH
ncbi:glycosyltransferase family 2 protein [Larkinella sp. VNQ87]|uniref:glycosyltransferase family 2 protein n=1 Tax=Larkinella sp. VNQ87 TaxID=3400921 RepID=UPI003C074D2B